MNQHGHGHDKQDHHQEAAKATPTPPAPTPVPRGWNKGFTPKELSVAALQGGISALQKLIDVYTEQLNNEVDDEFVTAAQKRVICQVNIDRAIAAQKSYADELATR